MTEYTNDPNIFKNLSGDLMEFADRISSVLGCPITIEDESHRLLAYSSHEDTTDSARISTIIGRRVPEKVINSLWKEGIIPALLTKDTPIIVDAISHVGLGNRAAVSIRKNNNILGFIWALEVNKPFSEKDLSFLHFAAKEAKNQLQLKKKRTEASHQEFLWRLLTGHYQNDHEISDNFKKHSLHLPLYFSVILFEFPEEISQEHQRYISYMLATSQKLKIHLFAVDQNKLIMLVGTDTESISVFSTSIIDFIPFFIYEMKKRFKVDSILGVAGNCYQEIINVKTCYEESLYMLKIKHIFQNELNTIYRYQDLGIFQLFKWYPGTHSHSNHPSIQILQEYDQKNHTELLHTLTIYLEADGNPHEASRLLHIHINTLNYRLKRISEIAQVQLKDPYQKMSILFDLKLCQYQQQAMKEYL